MSETFPNTIGKAPLETLPAKVEGEVKLQYVAYGQEKESPYLPAIRQLISNDLSEPYSIYVYRYFLYQWGDLCFMVNHSTRS
jgi:N-alpha-acetyltransferase 30